MTESFEDAITFARAIIADCDAPILDRLQKAHEHEMEQLRRLQFREGYEAGQRSMDAEHYQLKLRLQGLKLGDGSHENLSRLAYAIYPCPTGWGKESCEGLRDKLIELLGGVHDEPAQTVTSRCACDADCADRGGEPQTVAMCDVLDNERHKAVCELSKLTINSDYYGNYQRITRAIGTEYDGKSLASECVRDRLIHLLGGDPQTFRDKWNIRKGSESASADGQSRPDRLKGKTCDFVVLDELGGRSEDAQVVAEPNSQESPILSNCDTENGGEITITTELREYVSDHILKDIVLTTYPEQHEVHGVFEDFIAFADRIDERARLGAIKADTYRFYANQMRDERDELQASLREIAERVGVPHDIELDEYGDDLVAKATLGKIDSTHEHIGALEWQRDRQKKLLDEYDKMHVELPKDADGKCIHSGDLLEPATLSAARHLKSNPFEAKLFYGYLDGRYGINLSAPLDGGDAAVSPKSFRHATPEQRVESDADTAEDIVRDIHLGKVTDTQAVERIMALP